MDVRPPHWETLKKLIGSKLAQYVILVPVVGWLLVYQNTFARILSDAIGLDIEASLGWETLIFYIGLVCLGVASASFRAFAPDAILNFEGLPDYIERTEVILTLNEFRILCERIGVGMPDEVKAPAAPGQVSTRDQWLRLNSGGIRDVLSQHFRKQNASATPARYVVFVAFALGAAFTLIPTMITLTWVFAQLSAAIR